MSPYDLSILFRSLRMKYMDFNQALGMKSSEVVGWLCEKKQLTRDLYDDQSKELSRVKEALMPYTVVYPTHRLYPKAFMEIPDPPVFLSMLGDATLMQNSILTVVGSRRIMPDFSRWMDEHFLRFLKLSQGVTVSGGAYGVDYKATSLALFSDVPSVVILPSGLDVPYPRHVRPWKKETSVLLVSEYFPREELLPFHFIHRNRLLGTICQNLLVVQCAQKSGTMTTVRYALDNGGEVLTVPDLPGRIESSGNIQLLKDGAHLVASGEDLISSLSMFSPNP
jgi:DNA processing protein